MKTTQTLQAIAGALFTISILSSASATTAGPAQNRIHDSTTGLDYVEIPAGSFVMGTTDIGQAVADMPDPDAELLADETPAHRVVFERSFYISATEVTQGSWLQIMKTRPGPDTHWQHEHWQQLPVVSVSWDDAARFIDNLNAGNNRYRYRLPTEAEWEYVARAGNTALRPFSILEMDEHAWYLHSSNDQIQPVAKLEANAFGIYDMLGNAWEWAADWYRPDSYASSDTVNPQGPSSGSKKIRRGGSYHCPPHLIRPGYRAADYPDQAYSVLGFRLVLEKR